MKAVNQCIGRVIRHRGDWAAILLLDVRWTAGTTLLVHLDLKPLGLTSQCRSPALYLTGIWLEIYHVIVFLNLG